MSNVVLGCLLCTAAFLLINQQTLYVEAKPFLLLPRNFFVLTTRAPCTKDGETNCSDPSNSVGFSTSSNFQIPNLITPKLRILSTLLQGLSRGVSAGGSGGGGGISGGFGFGFKKFGIQGSATTTTTTSSPDDTDHTTAPGSVFEPDSSESSVSTTTSSYTSVSSTKGPGYSYETDELSADSNKNGGDGASSNVFISGRIGTDDNHNGNSGKPGSNGGNGNNGNNGDKGDKSYKYESNENIDTDSDLSTAGSNLNGGYSYGYDNVKSTTQRSGYQYGRPAENEVV